MKQSVIFCNFKGKSLISTKWWFDLGQLVSECSSLYHNDYTNMWHGQSCHHPCLVPTSLFHSCVMQRFYVKSMEAEKESKLHKPQQLHNIDPTFPSCQSWLDFESFTEMMEGIHTGKLFDFFINKLWKNHLDKSHRGSGAQYDSCRHWGGIVLQHDHYSATGPLTLRGDSTHHLPLSSTSITSKLRMDWFTLEGLMANGTTESVEMPVNPGLV